MPLSNSGFAKLLRFSEILLLLLIALSFYLLIASRTGEARTVWQVLHPAFIPTLFITTSLLLAILHSSEKTAYKLSLVIVYSILIHSFFSIIFPAGDLSGQQMVLGRTRLVFDNTILHGLSGYPTAMVQVLIIETAKGINSQAALSTVLARMLSLDIFYVHLSLVPALWGIFVPIASYLITKAIGASEKASVLSSLIVSVFPYTVYFGAISVPNSLGFIFFFYSLYFMLRYLSSSNSKNGYFMLAFTFFSMLAHYLAGVMTFSLLLLTVAFKALREEKKPSSRDSKILLLASFLLCMSLLPLSFIYLGLLGSPPAPVFTLEKLTELPLQEVIGLFLIGDLIYGSNLNTMILYIVGPLLGFLWMIYLLYHFRKKPNAQFREHIFFLFAAFLIMLIDYGILKIFMEGLPLNEERIWVFRDLIAAPFAGLAIFAVFSSVKAFLRMKSIPKKVDARLNVFSKNNFSRTSGLLLALNVMTVALLGGWVTFSLSAAYPQIAPIQTTWYELEAVRYIEANTKEKYVVIGDIWTIYAGEVIVGIKNPRAYYFGENDKTGHDLFVNMRNNPSAQWMLQAMNDTNTEVAYFMITEIRLGSNEFNNTVTLARQNNQLTEVNILNVSPQKLSVFSYKKE
jgi:hypothetical protein